MKKEIEPPPSPSSAEPVDGCALRDALRLTQDNIQTLQRMQTQTADLHRQFLSGQETAQQGLLDLIRQQQYLLDKTFGNGRVEFRPSAAPVRAPEPTPPVEVEKEIPTPEPIARTVAPAAPPEPAPQPQGPVASDSARIMAVLIEVVSANTGYPTEMLDPDMSLDADLGIDSIKRVEILSTLSERLPDIPAAGPDEVGKLSTLREVVDFLAGRSEAAPVQDPPGEASPVSGQDQVVPALLKAVSDHTGYPVEMLELDMKLDADLGIDSIKRVEILSALAETMPDLPVVEPDQVGRLQTLREVADFLSVEKKKTEPDPIEASRLAEPTVSADSPVDASVWETVCRVVEDLAGYDAAHLDQQMRLEEDLGFDPVSLVTLSETVGKRLSVDPEPLRVPLETLGCLARHFSTRNPLSDDGPGRDATPNPLASIDRYVLEALSLTDDESEAPNPPQGGPIWVIADDSGLSQALVREINEKGGLAERISWKDAHETPLPSDLAGLILIAPDDTHDDIMAAAFGLAKRAASALRQPSEAGPAVFATVSRLDGRFGLGGRLSNFNPVSGGLAGLAKTIHHEWPEVTAKAFDLDISESDFDGAARSMVAELTRSGPVEVGLADGRKWTLQIRPEPLADKEDALHLNREDVVLVSGGARGVTAEAALALARKWRPTLVLFGRTPLPDEEPDELAGLTGEAAIKKELFRQAPPGTTPVQVEQSYKRLVSAREVRENLKRLRETGSRAVYLQVDVTDRESVQAAVSVIRQDFGPIKGLVHGAGVLADRLIEDKTADQFTRVYTTKATGLATLLKALRKDPLQLMVLFSSSTGRFGRSGQVDYAMANEVLNKTAQKEAAARTGCRVVSFNWGPWAGGMVNPSLEKIFQNEGLATIPLEAGAEYMVREIASGQGGPVEIVILGAGSRLPEEVLVAAPTTSDERTIIERHLSIGRAPVLQSHVIDGQAVLPMALMIEWMARAGTGDNPEDSYIGFDGLEVHRRLTLEEPIDLIITAEPGEDQGRTRTRRVRLEARRGSEGVSHAECNVVLSKDYDLGRAALPEIPKNDYPHNGRFYEEGRLFHGPDLRGVVHIDGCGKSGIRGRIKTSPPVSDWFPESDESDWLTDPLALDSVFQMVILWCWEEHGLPALPVRVGRYRRSGTGYPTDTDLLAQVSIKKGDGPMIEADVEITDTEGRLVARLEDLVCFESESLVEAYRRNRLEPVMPKAAGSTSPKSGQLWPNDL